MKKLLCLMFFLPGLALGQDPGKALQFDGSDDVVQIPHQAGLTFASNAPGTIEFWLHPTSSQTIWHALGMRDSCGATINYQLARDTGNQLHFNGGCIFSANTVIPVNEWSHVAVTANGTTMSFYINAELVSQKTCGFGGASTAPLIIGGSSTCTPRFPGLIDEVRIWNTERSADELLSTYNCTFSDPPADLVGYWNFDEVESSQVVQDVSSSGFDGSLGNDTSPGSDDPVRVESTAPLTCASFIDGFEASD